MMTDAEKASKEVKQNSDESSTSSSSEVQGKEKLDQTGTEGKEKLKDQKASEAKESNQHPKSDKKSKKKSRKPPETTKEQAKVEVEIPISKEQTEKDKKEGQTVEEDDFDKRIIEILNKHNPEPPELTDLHYVCIAVWVNKIESFDTQEERAFVDIGVTTWWKDKTLVGKWGDDFPKDKIFNPSIEIQGSFKMRQCISPEVGGSWWILEKFSPYGIVSNYQRYKGLLHIPLDLHKFPFDTQVIKIIIKSSTWGEDCLKFINVGGEKIEDGMTENIDMQDWQLLTPIEAFVESEWGLEDGRYSSRFSLEIQLRRRSGYYIKNMMSLMFLILLMSWSVFFVPSALVDSRLSISLTLFLAAVAFNFVVEGELPKVSHFTYITKFFIVVYISLVLTVIENVIVFIVNDSGYADVARIIDWVSLGFLAFFNILFSLIFLIIGCLPPKKLPRVPARQKPPDKPKQKND